MQKKCPLLTLYWIPNQNNQIIIILRYRKYFSTSSITILIILTHLWMTGSAIVGHESHPGADLGILRGGDSGPEFFGGGGGG